VNPVRPSSLPAAPAQVQRPADAARLAAQKAFFEAALGKTAAAPAAAPPLPAAQAALQRRPDAADEAPQKILRPGSRLDIRV
jgi:hypothetical protein